MHKTKKKSKMDNWKWVFKLLFLIIIPISSEDCEYKCNKYNDGCKVKYTGPLRAGVRSSKLHSFSISYMF
jgi:hypothetical protein